MTPKELPEDSDEAVRRLLAAAAEPRVMPPEVSARLDDVLAELSAERMAERPTSGDPSPATVVDLAERRASRWPKVLVAAAALSVLGVGLGNVLNDTGLSMNQDTAGSGDARALGGAELAPEQPEGASEEPYAATDDRDGTVKERGALADGRARLRSSSVTVDAQRIADFRLPLETSTANSPGNPSGKTVSPGECPLPSTSKGDVRIAVRLDGEPATLVFRAEQDGRRLTEVFSCDDAGTPVLTTTVDAP